MFGPWSLMTMISSEYKYIVQIPGVRSGRAVIEGTRIGVHDVVGLFLSGADVDDITRDFPTLTRSQVYECLAFYEDHKSEIDLLVAQQMAAPDATS
jgi:uncharacterized protein (DUF433 family)